MDQSHPVGRVSGCTEFELPAALAKLEVPFEQRSGVAVKRRLRDRLLRETFQTYGNVSKALEDGRVRREM